MTKFPFSKPMFYSKSKLTLAIAAQMLVITPAWTAPTGGEIVGGTGSIEQQGTETTIVQNTDRLAIDWQGFDVGKNERVKFVQPGQSAVALNRILGNKGSEILGRIDANGHVILVNPNGVVFGQGAVVNAGGLIASGLQINPDDFMNGDLAFKRIEGADGTIINSGMINAAAGGNVVLLGKQVENRGLISARLGSVLLASGEEAVLIFDESGLLGVQVDKATLQNEIGSSAAVANSGEIRAENGRVLLSAATTRNVFSQAVNWGEHRQAQSVAYNEDGSFTLGAGGDVINSGAISTSGEGAGDVVVLGENITLSGTIHADAVDGKAGYVELHSNGTTIVSGRGIVTANGEQGGDIKLLGKNVGLMDRSAVEAMGTAGGGVVLVGGDREGLNSRVRNSDFVYINKDAFVNVSATDDGDGGTAIIFAEDTARVYGSLSSRGGKYVGNGGFIETSGKRGFEVSQTPDIGAVNGEGGHWLIDPHNITIGADGEGGLDNDNVFESTSDDAKIAVVTIVNALVDGATVTIKTGDKAPSNEKGNITIATNIELEESKTTATLNLVAHNDIVFDENASITAKNDTNSHLNVNLNANTSGEKGSIFFGKNVTINTNGGDFKIVGDTVNNNELGANDPAPGAYDIDLTNLTIDVGGGNFVAHAENKLTLRQDLNLGAGDLVLGAADWEFDKSDRPSAVAGISAGNGNITFYTGGELRLPSIHSAGDITLNVRDTKESGQFEVHNRTSSGGGRIEFSLGGTLTLNLGSQGSAEIHNILAGDKLGLAIESGQNATLQTDKAIHLHGTKLSGDLSLTSGLGITQAEGTHLKIEKSSMFAVENGSIKLDQENNVFGLVEEDSTFTAGTIWIDGKNVEEVVITSVQDLLLGQANRRMGVNGVLTLTSEKDIKQSGLWDVDGTATLSAGGDLNLDKENEFNLLSITGARRADVRNNETLKLAAIENVETLDLSVTGDVEQIPGSSLNLPNLILSVTGNTTLTNAKNQIENLAGDAVAGDIVTNGPLTFGDLVVRSDAAFKLRLAGKNARLSQVDDSILDVQSTTTISASEVTLSETSNISNGATLAFNDVEDFTLSGTVKGAESKMVVNGNDQGGTFQVSSGVLLDTLKLKNGTLSFDDGIQLQATNLHLIGLQGDIGTEGSPLEISVETLKLEGNKGNIYIRESDGVQLNGVSDNKLIDLEVNAGDLRQSSAITMSSGSLYLRAESGGIFLEHDANKIGAPISLSASESATVYTQGRLELGEVDVKSLILRAEEGIGSDGRIVVRGETSLKSGGKIIVDNENNIFSGTVFIDGLNDTDVVLKATEDLTLAHSTMEGSIGSLDAEAGGHITQKGALKVNNITLSADQITLEYKGNNFSSIGITGSDDTKGAESAKIVGSGDLELKNVTVDGAFELSGITNLTQSGALTLGELKLDMEGNAELLGDDNRIGILSGNAVAGKIVTNGPLILGDLTVKNGAPFELRVIGENASLSQAAESVLKVQSTTTISASEVTLSETSNISNGATLAFNDVEDFTLSGTVQGAESEMDVNGSDQGGTFTITADARWEGVKFHINGSEGVLQGPDLNNTWSIQTDGTHELSAGGQKLSFEKMKVLKGGSATDTLDYSEFSDGADITLWNLPEISAIEDIEIVKGKGNQALVAPANTSNTWIIGNGRNTLETVEKTTVEKANGDVVESVEILIKREIDFQGFTNLKGGSGVDEFIVELDGQGTDGSIPNYELYGGEGENSLRITDGTDEWSGAYGVSQNEVSQNDRPEFTFSFSKQERIKVGYQEIEDINLEGNLKQMKIKGLSENDEIQFGAGWWEIKEREELGVLKGYGKVIYGDGLQGLIVDGNGGSISLAADMNDRPPKAIQFPDSLTLQNATLFDGGIQLQTTNLHLKGLQGGIGKDDSPLIISVDSLELTNNTGNIYIRELNGMILNGLGGGELVDLKVMEGDLTQVGAITKDSGSLQLSATLGNIFLEHDANKIGAPISLSASESATVYTQGSLELGKVDVKNLNLRAEEGISSGERVVVRGETQLVSGGDIRFDNRCNDFGSIPTEENNFGSVSIEGIGGNQVDVNLVDSNELRLADVNISGDLVISAKKLSFNDLTIVGRLDVSAVEVVVSQLVLAKGDVVFNNPDNVTEATKVAGAWLIHSEHGLIFGVRTLTAADQMIEIETLAEIDPAIFTNVKNYFHQDVSVLLPADQRYDDSDEEDSLAEIDLESFTDVKNYSYQDVSVQLPLDRL